MSYDLNLEALPDPTPEADLQRAQQDLEAAVKSLGQHYPALSAPHRPALAWPADLTREPEEHIGSLMTWLSGMIATAQRQLAEEEAFLLLRELELEWHRAALLLRYKGAEERLSESAIKAKIALDGYSRSLEAARLGKLATTTYLKRTIAAYEQQYAVCSRELARRAIGG